MSDQYGKIEYTELVKHTKSWSFWFKIKDFNVFSNYLENKNAYIIHYFSSPERYRNTDYHGNRQIYSSNYVIDNYGNIYNVAQSSNTDRGFYGEKFLSLPKKPKELEWTNSPHNGDGQNHTFDIMHPYIIFDNKLSNKSIKLIKLINMCEEDCMKKLIENLLIENILEDKEDDIHFMRNKNKELRDTNKELLLKVDEMKYFLLKVDEMKEKHNELVNRLLDKIVELSDTLNTARMKINEKN